MLQIDFTQNWNGKLFLDTFGDIRIHNPVIHYVGSEVEVTLKGIAIGIVRIVAVKTFPANLITEVAAWINIGHPAAYQAELLRRFYSSSDRYKPDMMLDYMALSYTFRNIENQTSLLEDWWKSKSLI